MSDHAPVLPFRVVESVCATGPEVPAPAKIFTVTVAESPKARPAVPVMAGRGVKTVAPAAGAPTVTSGASVSTVHSASAGVSSGSPSASMARTRKLCSPSARPVRFCGEEQPLKGTLSRLHSNGGDPGDSVALNAKLASSLSTRPDGAESSVVCGLRAHRASRVFVPHPAREPVSSSYRSRTRSVQVPSASLPSKRESWSRCGRKLPV